MKSFVSLFKTPIAKIAILVALLFVSSVVIISVLLGNEAGSFVIQVKNGDPEASVSITEVDMEQLELDGKVPENSDLASMLTPEGVTSFIDYNPERFLENEYQTLKEYASKPGIVLEGSEKTGYNLYCYTFYIVNTGSGAININISMDYSKVTNYFDEVARVLTFCEKRYSGDDEVKIYQKQDKEPHTYKGYTITPKAFAEEGNGKGVVYNDEALMLDATTTNADGTKKYAYLKYSVLFWLEGEDPDSEFYNEKLYNGTIRYSLNIDVQ